MKMVVFGGFIMEYLVTVRKEKLTMFFHIWLLSFEEPKSPWKII